MNTHKVGDVLTFDYQSDVYGGQYRLVSKLTERGHWLAEEVEPSDETINWIMEDTSPYSRGEKEVLERIDRTGRRFKIKIVSREEFASYF